ncbi:3843_t:CDS:1 [Acaulospora morrowiae]|uniref:3843_t:CDS:1 n=1 Tax=Acaulospora morrowiae TaxID=94023 RepID=A0A9N9DP87_9GLOM|nr:3843_t:CDS:1 [Acaulospora morrowiae]
MFVRKLQAICILLILVILVKPSTAGPIITKDTKNSTNIANTTAEIDTYHPSHLVWMIVRGYLDPLNWIRLHWLDENGQARWHDEFDPNTGSHVLNFTSPNWAAGYLIEAYAEGWGNKWSPKIFWWDGWVGGKYCNDNHFYLKNLAREYAFGHNWEVIWGRDCTFPFS